MRKRGNPHGMAPLLLAVVALAAAAESAKILGVFPTDTGSHYLVYHRLMAELGRRGHQVTVLSLFPKEEKFENVRDIGLNGSIVTPTMNVEDYVTLSDLGNVLDVIKMCIDTCESVLNHQLILKVMEEQDFDLFITEIFATECFMAIGHKLGIPIIGVITSVNLPWANDWVGNPDNPSYIPLYYVPYSQEMNIFKRTYNTVMNIIMKAYYDIHSVRPSQRIAENVFGPLPSLTDIARNCSLILVNSHLSVNQARPMVPQNVEVGGLHIPKIIDKLPKDLQTYLDDSKHGLVYFSLGTFVPPETFEKQKLEDIIHVLGNLKENVLWKIDGSKLPKLPKNIKTSEWIPQLGVLCHNSTKVFIGHGGLLGMQEAVYCGKPMLGIPIFADQGHNVAQAQTKGFARGLSYFDLNKKTFSEYLESLLNDKKYTEIAIQLSNIFRDRPMHPMDTAVYWIEYVLKYKGAHHLKTRALNLEWYQYILLDVILLIGIIAVILFIIIYFIMKKTFIVLSNSCRKSKHKGETNNNIIRLKNE